MTYDFRYHFDLGKGSSSIKEDLKNVIYDMWSLTICEIGIIELHLRNGDTLKIKMNDVSEITVGDEALRVEYCSGSNQYDFTVKYDSIEYFKLINYYRWLEIKNRRNREGNVFPTPEPEWV